MKNCFVRTTDYPNVYINLWHCDAIEVGYDDFHEKEFACLYLDSEAHKDSSFYGVYDVIEEDVSIVKEFLKQN